MSDLPGNTVAHAFLYSAGRLTDLGTLGGAYSVGYAINASGEVTGASATASGSQDPFLFNGSSMKDLGTLGGTIGEGSGINGTGEVVGGSDLAGGTSFHGFIFNGRTIQDIGSLAGPFSDAAFSGAAGINNLGEVTGASTYLSPNSPEHAFLLHGTAMQDLGTLGGLVSQGVAINATGEVTGESELSNGTQHAFLWDGQMMHDLGTLYGGSSIGEGINSSGEVVGNIIVTNGPDTSFLYNAGTMYDLNKLISPSDPLFGQISGLVAWSINDSGQVAADGFVGGQSEAFILSPTASSVPEPASLALFAAGLCFLALVPGALRSAHLKVFASRLGDKANHME